jgi:signal peptidase I
MMGDNRDNSADSRVMRYVGFVPHENLVGPAQILFFSFADDTRWWQIWQWPLAIRYSRLLNTVD